MSDPADGGVNLGGAVMLTISRQNFAFDFFYVRFLVRRFHGLRETTPEWKLRGKEKNSFRTDYCALPRNLPQHLGVSREFLQKRKQAFDGFDWPMAGQASPDRIDLLQVVSRDQ